MEDELNTKLIILDEVKAMIKNQILEVEHSTSRDNYMRMLDRKMGMQIILCSVADMQFKLRREAESEISGTSGSCGEKK
ncbi:MAG: hypothetical protein IKE77_09205 [Erysipelotrichaceae bacterium]|nr:hypothetical protein [Erysipelotrichaceae bacterium]